MNQSGKWRVQVLFSIVYFIISSLEADFINRLILFWIILERHSRNEGRYLNTLVSSYLYSLT